MSPPKQVWYLSQNKSFLNLPLIRSFMLVPLLGRKDMDFIAGQMTSDDQPGQLSESSYSEYYQLSSIFYFYYSSYDQSRSESTFFLYLFTNFYFYILFQTSMDCLIQLCYMTIDIQKQKQYLFFSQISILVHQLKNQFLFYIFFQSQKIVYYFYIHFQVKNRRVMKLFLPFIVILIFQSILSQEPEIIDFTYAHVLQQVGTNQDQKDNIIIFPDTLQMQKYRFPEICQLKEKLDEGMDQSSSSTNFVYDDQHLNNLRQKILQLLRVSQKIKESKNSLVEMRQNHHIYEQEGNISRFDSDLNKLANKQQQLADLKRNISLTTQRLNQTLHSYNHNPRTHQFNNITLNYKIQLARNKIRFYKDLKYKIQHKTPQNKVKYDDFFRQLELQFQNATDRVNDIDSIISNYAYKKTLEEKIISLTNRIEIDKLLMQEKEDCNNSKTKIKNQNHFSEELKKTFEDLRLKKKEFYGMNNTQCQGVAKKLEDKIRSQLKIINRAYSCSEGLQEIQKSLQRKEGSLKILRFQLDNLKLGELELEHKSYNKSIDEINTEFQFMKTFTVSEYVHNSTEIDKLLNEEIKNKQTLEKQLSALPSVSSISISDVHSLVGQIKRLKARYCREYDQYQRQYKGTWNQISYFQKKHRQQSYNRKKYLHQGTKLVELQSQFKKLSQEIVSFLQQHKSFN